MSGMTLNYHPARIGWCFIYKEIQFLGESRRLLQFSDPEREDLAAVRWLSGGVGLSLPIVAYVITGLVLKGRVWGRRWQVQVHFPLVGCWVRGWSSLAPLGCLLLGSDCQRRGVRIPSEESYSKDISKSADFFLQFSFMNLSLVKRLSPVLTGQFCWNNSQQWLNFNSRSSSTGWVH